MNGGIAPFLLIAVTMALMLGLVPGRLALSGAAAFGSAALLGFMGPTLLPLTIVFAGLFGSLIVIAILTYIPAARWRHLVIPMSINAGLWLGACAAMTSTSGGLAIGLLPLLLYFLVDWIAQRKFLILIKVVASWMIAIASLSLFVSLVPTPGYKPDHME